MSRTFISILAGLGGMFGWGTSDFLANAASEKIGHAKTLFWSQIAGLVLIAVLLIITHTQFVMSPLFFVLSIVGGVAYALGYLLFYKGFEIGNVSVVSAVVNFQVLFVIAISYFIRGQNLTVFQIPAIAILLIGVTIVSVNFDDLKKGTVSLLQGVKETLLATILFGVIYWPLNEYVVEEVDWIAVSFITKFTAIIVVLVLSIYRKQSLNIQYKRNKLVILVASVGLLEAVGVLSATYGQSYGDGIIVAPISSALTVVTVTLAIIFTRERITKVQGLGIGLVVVGIMMSAF